MALVEETLFGREDKVQKAIDRLKAFEPPEGYFLAFSGGKDSQCVYHLAKMAGVKFEAHYSVTGIDPPELMRFIKKNYPDVIWDYRYWDDGKPEHYFPDGRPRQITMWSLIADHTIPPTRQARYCCSALKETGGKGRVVVTGVRWAESVRRKALHGVADIQTESKKIHEEAAKVPTYKMNKSGGGHISGRQRRSASDGRTVLYQAENDYKPYRRLDRRRCVGIYQRSRQSPVL